MSSCIPAGSCGQNTCSSPTRQENQTCLETFPWNFLRAPNFTLYSNVHPRCKACCPPQTGQHTLLASHDGKVTGNKRISKCINPW